MVESPTVLPDTDAVAPEPVQETLDPRTRQVLPLVWFVIGAVAIALAVGWFALQLAPPPAPRLLAVPGQPTAAEDHLSEPQAAPAASVRSTFMRPGGAVLGG
jgi:hypothetical protein